MSPTAKVQHATLMAPDMLHVSRVLISVLWTLATDDIFLAGGSMRRNGRPSPASAALPATRRRAAAAIWAAAAARSGDSEAAVAFGATAARRLFGVAGAVL